MKKLMFICGFSLIYIALLAAWSMWYIFIYATSQVQFTRFHWPSVNLNFMPRNALIDKAKAPRNWGTETPRDRETP